MGWKKSRGGGEGSSIGKMEIEKRKKKKREDIQVIKERKKSEDLWVRIPLWAWPLEGLIWAFSLRASHISIFPRSCLVVPRWNQAYCKMCSAALRLSLSLSVLCTYWLLESTLTPPLHVYELPNGRVHASWLTALFSLFWAWCSWVRPRWARHRCSTNAIFPSAESSMVFCTEDEKPLLSKPISAISSRFKDKEIEVQWLLDLHKMTLLFARGLGCKPFLALLCSIQIALFFEQLSQLTQKWIWKNSELS